MIVPEFWAESRLQNRQSGRQITVRRFGWSDASQADAQQHAQTRATAALERLLAGENLQRREPRLPYNGAEGVPIREEIIARHENCVITRNAYGAHCLNTQHVLFVDIDLEDRTPLRYTFLVLATLLLMTLAVYLMTSMKLPAIFLAIAALFFSSRLSTLMLRLWLSLAGGSESVASRRIEKFLARFPDWGARLYRTPAGLRLLVTHAVFTASDPVVSECFEQMGADPVYAKMCLRQQCFRARISPKPWRIGIKGSMRPRPGVWPVAPEHLPRRTAWIEHYEKTAAAYASCHFIKSYGIPDIHPEASSIIALHDRLCRSASGLPLA